MQRRRCLAYGSIRWPRPGRVRLRFLGAGADAVLDIGIVESNQTVDVIVRARGNTAALESVGRMTRRPSVWMVYRTATR